MQQFEGVYVDLIHKILVDGQARPGRNGETKSIFGFTMHVDMTNDNRFPLLHGRHIFYKGVLGELAAFFRGPKTIGDFEDWGCNYWGQWANVDGDINIDYGNKWLDFNGVNQIAEVSKSLREEPASRRHIVSGWDPSSLADSSLPCCHFLYQWYVRDDEYLDMIWYQRSVDTMVGLPSDIVLAAAWNILLANEVDLKPGKLTFNLGDCHIYEEHYEQAAIFAANRKIMRTYPEYNLRAEPGMPITEFDPDELEIEGYERPKMKFEVIA